MDSHNNGFDSSGSHVPNQLPFSQHMPSLNVQHENVNSISSHQQNFSHSMMNDPYSNSFLPLSQNGGQSSHQQSSAQNYSNPLHNISLSSHNSQSLMPSQIDSTIMSASSNNAHPNLAHGNLGGSGVHSSPMTPAGFSHPGGFAHGGGAGGGGGGTVAPHSPIQSPSSTFNSSWTAASYGIESTMDNEDRKLETAMDNEIRQ